MQELRFSVVIPTYNRAHLIVRTLESVFSQTYPAAEVIVVDNCSTDDTARVIEPYTADGRVRFHQNPENLERSFSRNVGMEMATGDYLTLLDSDDLMYPNNLSDAAAFAAQNPGIDCFHNLLEYVSLEGEVVYRPRLPDLTKDRLWAIANGNFMSCIGDFMHRRIYSKFRFDVSPGLIGSEDWDFWLRVLADNDVGRIPRYNSGLLQHPGRSMNTQSMDACRSALEQLVTKFSEDEHLSAVYRRYLPRIAATTQLYLAITANGGGLHARSLAYLAAAAKRDPKLTCSFRFLRALQLAIWGGLCASFGSAASRARGTSHSDPSL